LREVASWFNNLSVLGRKTWEYLEAKGLLLLPECIMPSIIIGLVPPKPRIFELLGYAEALRRARFTEEYGTITNIQSKASSKV